MGYDNVTRITLLSTAQARGTFLYTMTTVDTTICCQPVFVL